MSTLEFNLLGEAGYTGTLNDRRKRFYQAAGFENEYQYLSSLGYTGTVNDMRYQLAIANGLSGISELITTGGLVAYAGGGALAVVGSYAEAFINSGGNTHTINITDIGSTPQEGDLLVAITGNCWQSDLDRTTTVGAVTMTELADIFASDLTDVNMWAGYKVLDATDIAADTVNFAGAVSADNASTIAIFVIRSADETTPIDVTTATATGANTANANPPAITPVTEDALILVAAVGGSEAATSYTNNPDSLENLVNASGDDFKNSFIVAGSTPWVGGAFDPQVFTANVNSTSDSWCAVTIAIRPA